ncbi:MAG: hypothetical protein PVI06_20150 [Desulfobacterales bacterium]|jgi:hypothetical protein
MRFTDSDETFLNQCFNAADAAKMGDREKCKQFMAYFKERLRAVPSARIRSHFKLKDLEEAITWYKILIYAGYGPHEQDPRIKAMFTIIAKYIAENAAEQQKRELMLEFIQQEPD